MTTTHAPAVRLLVCGDRHGSDGGVAVWAAGLLLPTLREARTPRVEAVRCGHLDARQLLELASSAPLVILDAADGVAPGEVVVRSLDELIDEPAGPAPRSAAGKPIDQLLGVVNVLADAPLNGYFVGLGGLQFGYGEGLSPPVRAHLDEYVSAIRKAIERLNDPSPRVSDRRTGARGRLSAA
jgi:hydrogenase maturation protease